MHCEQILSSTCANGHLQRWMCQKGTPGTCDKCDIDLLRVVAKNKEEFIRHEKRDREQREHARNLQEVDDRIKQEREKLKDAQLTEERSRAIYRRRRDLEAITSLVDLTGSSHQKSATTLADSPYCLPLTNDRSVVHVPVRATEQVTTSEQIPPVVHPSSASVKRAKYVSSAEQEWRRQKEVDGETNEAIDAIMELTGLETVKAKILDIKAKVDLARRQGVSLKDRCNIALVGNPGTGEHIQFDALVPCLIHYTREDNGCSTSRSVSCVYPGHSRNGICRSDWLGPCQRRSCWDQETHR
jgi:hypothetical protein